MINDVTKKIETIADKFSNNIIGYREYFHANPELSFEEYNTSAKVMEVLDSFGIEYKKIAKTGVLAIITGNKKSDNPKTILLRGDMDALPIEEEVDVSYKSKIKGIMHACGHDSHTAGLLGSALILNKLKDEFSGNIKFAFQPAEESIGGAQVMIKEGALENPKVDAAFGLHVWAELEEGKITSRGGSLMAAPDFFHIKIKGRGGHGSMPNLAIDPILMTSEIIMAFQTIVSRITSPLDPTVISVTKVNGGTATNVIPECVEIGGTIRTLSEETREYVPQMMEKIVKSITDIYGGAYEINIEKGYPVLINDSNSVNTALTSASKIIGKENISILKNPTMAGEDFAFFSQLVPSAFIFLGIAKDMDSQPLFHHPKFSFDSKVSVTSAKILSQIAIDFLEKN